MTSEPATTQPGRVQVPRLRPARRARCRSRPPAGVLRGPRAHQGDRVAGTPPPGRRRSRDDRRGRHRQAGHPRAADRR